MAVKIIRRMKITKYPKQFKNTVLGYYLSHFCAKKRTKPEKYPERINPSVSGYQNIPSGLEFAVQDILMDAGQPIATLGQE